MRFIFLGPPGVGKGTVAERMIDRFELIQISTGDLLRTAGKQGTELGLRAKAFMDNGDLVPDDLVIAMLTERIAAPDCAGGYILDGFPRTIAQAEALEKSGVAIDRVINFRVDDALIVYRLSARRIHRDTGQIFSINPDGTNRPPDDMAPELLIQREDDKPEAIAHRLEVYREQTEPLIAFYQQRNLLLDLDGALDVGSLIDEIKAHMAI